MNRRGFLRTCALGVTAAFVAPSIIGSVKKTLPPPPIKFHGLEHYDLQATAKMVYPVNTPIRRLVRSPEPFGVSMVRGRVHDWPTL